MRQCAVTCLRLGRRGIQTAARLIFVASHGGERRAPRHLRRRGTLAALMRDVVDARLGRVGQALGRGQKRYVVCPCESPNTITLAGATR